MGISISAFLGIAAPVKVLIARGLFGGSSKISWLPAGFSLRISKIPLLFSSIVELIAYPSILDKGNSGISLGAKISLARILSKESYKNTLVVPQGLIVWEFKISFACE